MLFVAVAVATALVYAGWVVWVPLLPTNLARPALDLGQLTGYTWTSAWGFLLIVVVLFWLYALGYRAVAAGQQPIRTAWVFAGAAVFSAELLLAYPATAADVFGYIADGQLLALHHVNPLVVAPIAFPQDAIVPFLVYPGEPSQYGPLWVALSGAMASLTSTDLLQEVLGYKLIAVVAHLANGAVIYQIAARLTRSAERGRCSAFLFLWNPLLLWEMAANAHNDGLMLLFGLLGIWLFVEGRDLLALACVSLGALVKVPIALIGPVLFVGILRRNRVRALEGAFLGLVLAALVYRSFWAGPQTLTALQRSDLFTASLAAVLRLALLPEFGLDVASSVARTVSLSAFSIIAVLSVVAALAAETDTERLRAGLLDAARGGAVADHVVSGLVPRLAIRRRRGIRRDTTPHRSGRAQPRGTVAVLRVHLRVAAGLSAHRNARYSADGVSRVAWTACSRVRLAGTPAAAATDIGVLGRIPLGRGNASCVARAYGRLAPC